MSEASSSRPGIFVCNPSDAPPSDSATACASAILTPLARRAYRRPVSNQDLEPLLEFFEEGAAADGFDVGSIEDAGAADIVCILVPDDVIPHLPLKRQPGNLTIVASGYCYGYDRFQHPSMRGVHHCSGSP